MLISLNWLKKYIDLENISVEEIVDSLTNSGLEVEEVTDKNKLYENFVVGYVKEKTKHPNADKLSLCIVTDGSDDFNVVCGAPNVAAGQKIAFAKINAVIPEGGFKITKAKIRGEVSEGMICSERELSLSDNHEGILVLNEDAVQGTALSKQLGLDDVIIEVAITPNRADALSHIGIARDLAAIFDKELVLPEIKFQEDDKPSSEFVSIEIKNQEGCPRYTGRVVTDVTIKDSPEWLKNCLTAIGLRPINNIVDITNFILHEYGQPLHAFDLDNLAGNIIIVKNASDSEKFVTLDSKERKMTSDDLMICDSEKGIAIAGVMGGENSEVTDKTTNILIESAYFSASSVRKTAKGLGLSTDASYRFERGCDQEIVITASDRAAQLIAELGGGKIAKGIIDINPVPFSPKKVKLRFSRIQRVLGYEVRYNEVARILVKLGFTISADSDTENIFVYVPSFRHDIEREIDLIEEIARIKGYNEIPAVERISVSLDAKIDQSSNNNSIRDLMIYLQFNEILTNSLLSEQTAEEFGKPLAILNPQSTEMSHLRTSLIPGMLMTIARNERVKENDLRFFEIGHTFNKVSDSGIKDFSDFSEENHLLIAVSGYARNNNWYEKERKYDIYDLKGIVESFVNKFSLDKDLIDSYNSPDDKLLEFGYSKSFKNKMIGYGGKVKSSVLKNYDIDSDVFLFDINLDSLFELKRKDRKYTGLLKYPKMIKDFAVVIDADINSGEIIKEIFSINSKLLRDIKVFDVFVSENLGKNKKSIAFQLDFYDETRTLTEEEVERDFWKAIEIVKKSFNAVLRG